MNFEEFTSSLENPSPPQLNVYLTALWYDGKGDWKKAHDLINDLNGSDAAHVHAYLHRKEGDNGNARYWYHRAAQPVCTEPLQKEWENIVRLLL